MLSPNVPVTSALAVSSEAKPHAHELEWIGNRIMLASAIIFKLMLDRPEV